MELAGCIEGSRHVRRTARGITDSQCSTFAMLRAYSRRLPAAQVHMELMAVSRALNIQPRISHRHQDHNVWADQLTEGDFTGCNPELRWSPTLHDNYFYDLDHVSALARDEVY